MAIEGEFKIVDFEEPPEYLRVLNEQKRVKLSRKIQRDDRIIVTFSFKLSTKDLTVSNGIIRIGSSSSYAIQMDCEFSKAPVCRLKHPLTTQPLTIEMYAKDLKKELQVEYFGKVQFEFLDKEIRVWGSKKKLTISPKHPYTEMDEISIENLIVSSVEHTKHGGDLAEYGFETTNLNVEDFPILKIPEENEKDDRMPLDPKGTSYTFMVPESKFDYFGLENENNFVFDIKLFKRMVTGNQAKHEWNNIQVDFWNRRLNEPVFQLHLDNDHYDFKPSEKPKTMKFTKHVGYDLLGIRFEVSIKKDMKNTVKMYQTGYNISSAEIHRPFSNFDEIRLTANTSKFYEVTMKSLKEVVITTCNYRNLGFGITQKEVPYRSDIFKNRNILCEKKALNIDAKPPQDSVEEYVWREKEEVKAENSTTESVDIIKEIERIEKNRSLVEEVKKKEEPLGDIQNVALFQWSIIAMTTLTFASFTAIVILNLIRGWL
ncbi:hypothetical protein CAEBREN_04204 [Caenorhabditis brenneri]|uniref:Uncharacterized protein n=1 Tax=Caenorhabditis brenneri TaxID=135651 RepID=G0NFI4_CAEBE|nr:hypothetical protein CAEBREN_04204 [Caenorhabditis brenneri]